MIHKIKVIGIGQCGMRIGKVFERVGVDAAYINSDEVDVRGYDIPEEKLLLLKNSGTGKSINKGAEIVEKNLSKFQNFIKRNTSKNAINIFICGGGGGTGGGFITPAVKYALELNVKTGVIYTLPTKMLGIISSENSLRTLKQLRQYKPHFFFLADNEYIVSKISTGKDWWDAVNTKIVNTVLAPCNILRAWGR